MEQGLEEKLKKMLMGVEGADDRARRAAAAYVRTLAAPPGSLGRLAEAAVSLAGITGQVKNTLKKRRIIVLCADNGVVAEGVSVTPQSVTASQALNMTRHITGMSSLAAHFGDEVEVVDVGIATPYEVLGSGLLQRPIRRGTGNIAKEPAMSREEAVAAIFVGIERAGQAKADGADVIGVGEMGIGNTTTSSAVLAALTHLPVEAVTGRGGGLTDEAFARKKQVIARALALHDLKKAPPEEPAAAYPLENKNIPGAKVGKKPGMEATAFVDVMSNDWVRPDMEEATPIDVLAKVREWPVKAEADPIDVLAKVGGLDIAAMCGVYLGAAIYRLPVVVDGFISIAAALCAQRLCGRAREFMFPSHASEEAGYMWAARELGLDPWLHMNMRLGEGSGCPLAFRILEASCALMNEMGTFEDAKIDDGYLAGLGSHGGRCDA